MKPFFADAHSCLPLHGDTDINQLRLHYEGGARYVSINVGMDMNPSEQVLKTIAGFRAQIAASDYLILCETYADILYALEKNLLGVSFDLEGGIPLLEMPEMVQVFHRLGVRQVHLVYNRNNSLAGGAHDKEQGLTKLGEKMVDAIHEAGILMDLSHSQEKTALDICAHSGNRPVIYSHTNPRAIASHKRNATDRALKACAATGGVIGINGIGRFVGAPVLTPTAMANIIDYVVQLVGINHVAIGLDYCYDDGISDLPAGTDRTFWWPLQDYDPNDPLDSTYISPKSMSEICIILENRGYTEKDIQAIMWDNLLNLIQRVWK